VFGDQVGLVFFHGFVQLGALFDQRQRVGHVAFHAGHLRFEGVGLFAHFVEVAQVVVENLVLVGAFDFHLVDGVFGVGGNGVVQNKDNGYEGAVDVSEFTRLWLDQDLHRNGEYTDDAKPYLAMTFAGNQYLKRTV
jgi:hypothetical protein